MPERFYQASIFLLLLWFLNTVDPGLKIAGVTAEGMINAFRGDKRLLRWQKKGVGKGEFFPPCTGRDVFPLPVVFAFSVFCLYLAPQAERSVLLPRYLFLFIFFRFFSACTAGCLFLFTP